MNYTIEELLAVLLYESKTDIPNYYWIASECNNLIEMCVDKIKEQETK